MEKGTYVDGFVIVIPKKNAAAYKKMAKMGAKMWRDFGALDYKECRGEDLKLNMGGVPSRDFKKLTGAKPKKDVWWHNDRVTITCLHAMGYFSLIVVGAVIVLILASLRQINQYERGLKFTMGRYT